MISFQQPEYHNIDGKPHKVRWTPGYRTIQRIGAQNRVIGKITVQRWDGKQHVTIGYADTHNDARKIATDFSNARRKAATGLPLTIRVTEDPASITDIDALMQQMTGIGTLTINGLVLDVRLDAGDARMFATVAKAANPHAA